MLSASVTALAQGPTYRLGTTPSPEEIKARDTAVSPRGRELPPGSGTVKEGATVYAQKCQACHGPNGTGTRLHRGLIPLGNAKPVKIQGSLVPYATTVWDFINRAMPSTKPGSLTADEVYAVTAYVLFLNEVVKENDVVDAKTLPNDPDAEPRQLPRGRDRLETRAATPARILPAMTRAARRYSALVTVTPNGG